MYFRKSLILQGILSTILRFLNQNISGASVKSGGQLNKKYFKHLVQKWTKSEKNFNFDLNLAKNGLS